MKTEQIKQTANQLFKEGDYTNAFQTLWSLGVEDFIAYSQKIRQNKTDWFADEKSAPIFWSELILKDHFFTEIFRSKNAFLILHSYYSKTNLFIKEFEAKLAKEFPLIFIKAIKVNQVFFDPNKIDFICDKIQLADNLAIHQDLWYFMHHEELEIWNEIESTFKKIIAYPIDDILTTMIAYIETSNYNNNFEVINQASLSDSYNFFIEMLLKHPKINISNTNEEGFTSIFNKNTLNNPKQNLYNAIKKCFITINARNNVFSKVYDNYSFNKETEIKYIYESIYLLEYPESFYRWTKDEYRYKIAEQISMNNGSKIVQDNIEKGAKIKSKHQKDLKDNINLAKKMTSIISTLRLLKLDTFEIKNKSYDIAEIINPIHAFSYNRYIRYYKSIKNIKASNTKFSTSWVSALAKNVLDNKETLQVPYVYLSNQEYHELNIKNKVKKETSEAILYQFSYEFKDKIFNRFYSNYDVNTKPFVNIGDYIFSPVLSFTNYVGLFNFINVILQNNNRKSANQIEELLSDILKASNFNIFTPTSDDVNKIDGDADIIIYDDKTVILLQLKRTKLRLDLKKQYEEHLSVDLKAANQLNRAEVFLKQQNNIFEIGNREVKKWIVSNSFEKINTVIDNCLKVNYLDLVNFFMNEDLYFKTLSDFIKFNEQDIYYYTQAFEFQLPNNAYVLKEMNRYFIPLYSFNDKKMVPYAKAFSKSLDLYNNKKYKESIKQLNKCLKNEQNDPLVYEALASCYVAVKNLNKAKRYYEKALAIIPNDPFISRNYYSLLFEIGEEQKALNDYIDLILKYPLIKEIKGVFNILLKRQNLAKEQLEQIDNRMKEHGYYFFNNL